MRVALLLLAAVAVPTASADIGIRHVAPSVVRPGERVRAVVDGYLPLRSARMPVVLVPAERLPRPYPCRDGTSVCSPIVWRGRLGRAPYRVVAFVSRWRRDRGLPDHAHAAVTFRVPAVAPGPYVLALWCGACWKGPQGSLIGGPPLTVG